MKKHNITLYDKYNYDYSAYWQSREYEHSAEVHALQGIFKKISGGWFVDIGGSYGRHIPLYYQKFHNCILLDYSVKSLQKARETLKKQGISNVYCVAANAYHLPLKSESIDTAMVVRVLHHIEDPDSFFEEVRSILKPNGHFILEFANKNNIKAILRSIFTFKFSRIFFDAPINVPTAKPEGARTTDPGLMYNFSYVFLRKLLVSHEMILNRTYPVSFLRIPGLKRLLSYSLLTRTEFLFQSLLGWSRVTPSIIISSQRRSPPIDQPRDTSNEPSTLTDILVCPSCKSALEWKGSRIQCTSCSEVYSQAHGVIDVRYPKIQT